MSIFPVMTVYCQSAVLLQGRWSGVVAVWGLWAGDALMPACAVTAARHMLCNLQILVGTE